MNEDKWAGLPSTKANPMRSAPVGATVDHQGHQDQDHQGRDTRVFGEIAVAIQVRPVLFAVKNPKAFVDKMEFGLVMPNESKFAMPASDE